MVYDYSTEEFRFNYKLVETGESTFIGFIEKWIHIGPDKKPYTKMMNKSFVLGGYEEDVLEPPVVIEPGPEKDPSAPDPIDSDWFSLFDWDDTVNFYRLQRRAK